MNTSPPGAPVPPSAPPAAVPTLGAILGSILGTVVVAKTGLGADPVLGGTVITAITGLLTGVFHWLGTKLGASW